MKETKKDTKGTKESQRIYSKALEVSKASKEVSKESSKESSKEVSRVPKGLRVQSPLTEELDRLVYDLIGIGMDVHSAFGPGLREQIYEDAYIIALEAKGINYVRQVPFHVTYKGQSVRPIRLDLVVEDQVIVELKAVRELHDVHYSQMMTYLKLTDLPVGVILNFNVRHLRDGIKRFVCKG
jgi:GxxExxY protein